MTSDTGKWIFIIGIAIAAIGAFLFFFHDKLHWIGHLPGDIRVEKESFRFYFPLTTLLLINAVIWILLRIFRSKGE